MEANMKYEIKHFSEKEADAFFANVKPNDQTPVVNLFSGDVTTCGALATGRSSQGPRSHEDYLFPEHASVEKAEKWWDGLRRIDYSGATYTIIDGEQHMAENTYYGLGINSVDKRLYKLVWQAQPAVVEPLVDAEHSSLILEPEPICDWDSPVSVELMD